MKSLLRLVALLVVLALAAGLWLQRWATRALVDGPAVAVEATIASGSSVRSIGTQIAATGLPLHPWLFEALARVSQRASRLQAGTYAFRTTETPWRIVQRLQAGDVVRLALVVPEGWTFAQMRNLVAHRPDLRQSAAGLDEAALMKAIGATTDRAEGQFFPDTYLFTKGTTDLDIYRRAHHALRKRLDDAWAARAPDLPFATADDALTLASIVEKETGRADDRPLVAAVFVNRLRRGMPLQTDPTVIYGLGTRFDGNLHKADLVTDTPYNTYTRPGLPPTPIALVGAAALTAVLNPPRSDALFFVARGDGTSEFSERLADHNRAVDRYQRGGPTQPRP